ncbi:MAG: hypothetical protein PW734_00985 [Verrucomicrobium sp.]|nr:hypothetical protein [Verrucomicrobium sp.]
MKRAALLLLFLGAAAVAAEKPASAPNLGTPRGSDPEEVKSLIKSQLDSRWTVVRQVDLSTGYCVDRVVEPQGTAESVWPIDPAGSRFDLYSMPWGHTHWTLINSRTIFPGGGLAQIDFDTSDATRSGRTEHGAPLFINVQVPKQGEYLLTADGEDPLGTPLEHYNSWKFSHYFSVTVKAENLKGRDVFRLFEKRNGKWVLLAKNGIEVLPSPRIGWNLGDHPVLHRPLPTLTVIGRNLHPEGVAHVDLVRTVAGVPVHRQVLMEYSKREDFDLWKELSSLKLEPGSYRVEVIYKSPIGEASQRPESWKERTLFHETFQVR